jgi:hypothetical protein
MYLSHSRPTPKLHHSHTVIMSIFSKIKKARQAAAEHKKATEVQAEEVEPLPAPYKHVPTHAAFDALVATPMIYSPEENRARIAAARKTHSERSAFASVTTLPSAQRSYAHLRASSEVNLATHPAHRPRKDLSIDSVIQQPQPGMQQPKLSTRRSLPTMTHENDYSLPPNDFHAFGQPRDAPAPPRRQKPYRASHAASSSSSEARRKSPLSNVPTEESRCCGLPPPRFHTNIVTASDDNYSHSSQNSTCSTTSSYERMSPPSRQQPTIISYP